jgi:electron transport complex protein RnfC
MKDVDELKALKVNLCIECGCCQFTCPADIPLLDFIRMGKQEVGALIRARAAAHATKK